jgi:hypothetical protein
MVVPAVSLSVRDLGERQMLRPCPQPAEEGWAKGKEHMSSESRLINTLSRNFSMSSIYIS